MKKILSIIAITAAILMTSNNVNAQNISISINIGNQPAWGPTGYDYVDYYYFPDFNSYYDINSGLFIYFDSGRWISAKYLPAVYRHFDLYKIYKVALNVHKPWLHNKRHIKSYSKYKNHYGRQVVIRDSRDHRYYKSKTNYRPWAPNKDHKFNSRPNNRPDYNSNRPNVSNNRPNNKSSNSIERPNSNRPQNNKDGNNRPSYGKGNSKNNQSNNRPKNEKDNKVTTRPNNSSSRPSYNSERNKNKNSNSSNQSTRNRNSNSDNRRSTYYQTKF